jgi:flagellar hook protein FlgE
MSIYRAMYSGVSGLTSESSVMSVLGDNIANVNTVGFKQSRGIFEDVLGGASGSGAGAGVRMARTQQIFSGGAALRTGNWSDLQLNGEGFFVVKGTLNGQSGDFYTRAGQLRQAEDGRLMTQNGMAVQGFKANGDGTYASDVSDITIPAAAMGPKMTAEIKVGANLDTQQAVQSGPFDVTDPTTFDTNAVPTMEVFDSQGGSHTLKLHFTRENPGNDWVMNYVFDGTPLAGSETVSFDTSGKLTSASSVTVTPAIPGGKVVSPMSIDIDLSGLSQFATPSTVTENSADGYTSGDLSSVSINDAGVVTGVYTNGEKVELSQLAVAKFRANDGLARMGGNLWSSTRTSGAPVVGTANTGGRGSISAEFLEGSNVDISQQFVEMITHQRAFSANSRIITTADEMLQEAMSIKR